MDAIKHAVPRVSKSGIVAGLQLSSPISVESAPTLEGRHTVSYLKPDLKPSVLIRFIIRVNTEVLCSAAIGSDCRCFYNTLTPLSLSLLLLLYPKLYMDMVHQDPKDG